MDHIPAIDVPIGRDWFYLTRSECATIISMSSRIGCGGMKNCFFFLTPRRPKNVQKTLVALLSTDSKTYPIAIQFIFFFKEKKGKVYRFISSLFIYSDRNNKDILLRR